jgi:L-seryl-tRNA(Ser) seleniumtransferase
MIMSLVAEILRAMSNVLRNIPSVNDLLESPPLRRVLGAANRSAVVSSVRHFLDNLRQEVQNAAAEVDLADAR